MFNIYNIRIEFLFSEQHIFFSFNIFNIVKIIMIGGYICRTQKLQKQLKR